MKDGTQVPVTSASLPSCRIGTRTSVLVGAVVMAAAALAGAAGEPAPPVQTKCPVMVNNDIDPSISTVYRGKKVYFCCLTCKAAFAKDPQAYLDRLPQFASADATADGGAAALAHEEMEGSVAELIAPFGAATLSLVALTVLLGFLRRARRLGVRRMLTIHKTVGILALLFGLAHLTLVLVAD